MGTDVPESWVESSYKSKKGLAHLGLEFVAIGKKPFLIIIISQIDKKLKKTLGETGHFTFASVISRKMVNPVVPEHLDQDIHRFESGLPVDLAGDFEAVHDFRF